VIVTERISMWSQVMQSRYIADAVCPQCGETNRKGCKHLFEINEQGYVYCNACGLSYVAPRPTVRAVNE